MSDPSDTCVMTIWENQTKKGKDWVAYKKRPWVSEVAGTECDPPDEYKVPASSGAGIAIGKSSSKTVVNATRMDGNMLVRWRECITGAQGLQGGAEMERQSEAEVMGQSCKEGCQEADRN